MRFPLGGGARGSRPESRAGGEYRSDWHGWGTLENTARHGGNRLRSPAPGAPSGRQRPPGCRRHGEGVRARGPLATPRPASVSEPTIPDAESVSPVRWIGARWVNGCKSTGSDRVAVAGSFSQPRVQPCCPLGCCRSSSLLLRCN
ncbi:unnamed protein product [Coccothraustes coccothraustes]